MPSAKRVGERIRAWRLRRKLTQEELGEKIGSDGPRVGRLEKGSENPTLETIDKLAAALDIDVSRLFTPRPDDEAGHVPDAREGNFVLLDKLYSKVTAEFPEEDSWEGDVYKAVAALDRALRRARAAKQAPESRPSARRRTASDS